MNATLFSCFYCARSTKQSPAHPPIFQKGTGVDYYRGAPKDYHVIYPSCCFQCVDAWRDIPTELCSERVQKQALMADEQSEKSVAVQAAARTIYAEPGRKNPNEV